MLGKTPPPHTPARVFTLALLALTLFAPLPVSARRQTQAQQEQDAKSLRQPTKDTPIVELPDKSKRYGLIIGVDKYDDTDIPQLLGAANDAKSIAGALVKYAGFREENIELLATGQAGPNKQPSRASIINAIHVIMRRIRASGGDGMLVVAFSGHGVQRKTDGKVFLLPSDAQRDPETFDWLAIRVDELKELINKTGVSQVILLLDSCRNDPTAGRGDADNIMSPSFAQAGALDRRNSGIRGVVTLFAASPGERAWEYKSQQQGYFSWAFVEGLKGAAKDERGDVTLRSLINYLQSEVPRRADMDGKKQVPYPVVEGFADNLVLAASTKPPPVIPPPTPKKVEPALPTTGTLSVVSEPGALITIEPLSGGAQAKVEGVADGSGVYKADQLPFGDYRITAAREGSVADSAREKLAANKPTALVPLKLKEATYTLTVSANVASGSVSVSAKGETRLYQLQGGRAVVPGLSRGDYTVAITPDDVAYQPKAEPVALKGDFEHRFTLKSNLRKIPLDAEFGLADQWRLPAGWSARPSLEVNGEGRAMLREEMGRFDNFELSTQVELLSGTSVSFIVRAVDEQNYYLVRLSGPRADKPNRLTLYLVRNGQEPRSLRDISLQSYKLTDQFIFDVQVNGGEFKFFIDDNSFRDGKPVGRDIVGAYTDNTFAAGSVGVAAGRGDKAKIYQYLVCPGTCPRN